MRHVLLTQILPFLLAIACGPIWIWVFDETPPVVYYNIAPITLEAHRGGDLKLKVQGVRAYRCDDTLVYQTIRDSAGMVYHLPTRRTVIPQDKVSQLVEGATTVQVPLGAALGRAAYEAKVEYRCNLWRRYVAPLTYYEPEIMFTILPEAPR